MALVEDILKALGDTTRIRIVQMLAENGEMCVCRIMPALNMTQPAVSHHLAVLKHAGLVNSRREGQWVHYSLCCEALAEIAAFLQDAVRTAESAPAAEACCKQSA